MLEGEQLFPISEARNLVPLSQKPHPATVRRWAWGLQGRRLESVKIGGRVYTSKEALLRFIDSGADARQEGGDE
jgi:hypothetical protein